MSRLTLSEIWIYPIKSLAGIRVKQANVKQKGLEYDRRWMLVDETGRFITQREHPQMVMFNLSLLERELVITKNSAQLTIPINVEAGESRKVTIWDDAVEAIEPDPTYSQWFSDHLGFKCRLVFFPEINIRDVDPKYVFNQEQVSLADGYPYLIIGQSSLQDLNNRLEVPVEMKRFRPNFVFTGGEAFEEDSWKEFSIGSGKFKGVKNCARCVLITVDPQTGEKGREPLSMLSTYRKRENKIFFGQNVIALSENKIYEGDEIRLG
jgi:uncharacterized protein